jgi:hypothetical protein
MLSFDIFSESHQKLTYKEILEEYKKEFAGLTRLQIQKKMKAAGFKMKHSSGATFIHPKLNSYIIKLAYLCGPKPRRAAKSAYIRNFIAYKSCWDYKDLSLMIQEKCDCSYKAQKKAYKEFEDLTWRQWEDNGSCNVGISPQGESVIIDW